MGIFSIDNLKNLKESNNRNIIVNDEDSSFFIESLYMILEENKKFAVESILERKNITTLNTSPSDALTVMDKRLDMFISNMEKLLKKFEGIMTRMGSETSLLKDYSVKDFTSIKHTIKYNYTVYNYTNIGVYNSYTSYQTLVNDVYSILLRNLENFAKIKNSRDFEKEYERVSKQRNIHIGNEYRGKLLGKKYDIYDSNTEENIDKLFFNQLKKYFTGDGDDEKFDSFEYDPKRISSLAKSFYSNADLQCIKKECKEIISAARDFQSQIRKLNLDDYITTASNKQEWYNHSAKTTFDSIINNALYRVQIIDQIYIKYIAAKMEAAIANRKQDIKILKYILKRGWRE